MHGIYVVWTWLGPDGNPIYVGWGKSIITHPSKYVWAQRTSYPSELNRYLCSLEREPDKRPGPRLGKDEACYTCQQLRQTFKTEGHRILDSRPDGTRKGGGGSRQILGPDLQMYESVRRAAADQGLHPSTITRFCQSDSSDWSYLN